MIFRWDPCGLICVVFAYAAVFYADYVVVAWLVMPALSDSLWGVFHVVVFNIILFLLIFAHTRAMMSDPGIVPLPRMQMDFSDMQESNSRTNLNRRDSSDAELGRNAYVGEDWTVCGRCEAYRPPRAHHCRVCKRCVRKMDHHCPWVNNCVGEFNQKYFVQFLIYVGLASLYCICLVLGTWLLPCAECRGEKIKHTRVLHSIFVSIECVLFCLFVVAVSCDQIQAILSDETAVEHVQRRGTRKPTKSKLELMREVCGPGPIWFWLLPCHGVPSKRDLVHIPSYQRV